MRPVCEIPDVSLCSEITWGLVVSTMLSASEEDDFRTRGRFFLLMSPGLFDN